MHSNTLANFRSSSVSMSNLFTGNLLELERLFKVHQLNYEKWGVATGKTIGDLKYEIEQGEAFLELNPLRRRVEVVYLSIVRDGKILVEVSQTLQNGTVRPRFLLPAEKLHANEHPKVGAIRCLEEEFETYPFQDVTVKLERKFSKQTPSYSYLGLQTLYQQHYFKIDSPSIAELPTADFTTNEAASVPPNTVKSHIWSWIPLTDERIPSLLR